MKICPKCNGFYTDTDDICQDCNIKLYDKKQYSEIYNELKDMTQNEIKKCCYKSRYSTICKYQFGINTYTNTNDKSNNSVQQMEKDILQQDTLKCPQCGSTAVSTGARGFSIVTGFLGSGQTVNRCGNCGHKWKPKG